MKQRALFPARRPASAGLLAGGALALLLCLPALAASEAGAPNRAARAAPAGQDARQLVQWVLASGNHQGQPFAVIDKRAAMVHVFDADGRPRGASPVLIGLAPGDHSVPGIGQRKMSQIRPHERTTPAGRFVSEPGRNLQGEDIVWIDYDAAVSMHRVRAANKADRRLERLATPTPADNRISYGCVNVPAAFYDARIKPVFGVRQALIYVLPDTRPVEAVFGMGGRRVSSAGQGAITP